MQWNLRLRAAERGIWKSAELRRMLAGAGLEISAGKMSSWWAGTPITMRLDDLDVLCDVLGCTMNDLMSPEPDKVAARRPHAADAVNGDDQPRRQQSEPGTGTAAAGHTSLDPAAVGDADISGYGGWDRARADARTWAERSAEVASQVQPLSDQPRRVDQSTGRLLLRLPARRTVRVATLPAMRGPGRLLQPGPVQSLPSPQPGAHRRLQGLPGLGRVPPSQLDLLVLQSGGRATTRRGRASTAAAPPTSATPWLAACAWRTLASTKRPAARPTSLGRTGTANNCSSPTWPSNAA